MVRSVDPWDRALVGARRHKESTLARMNSRKDDSVCVVSWDLDSTGQTWSPKYGTFKTSQAMVQAYARHVEMTGLTRGACEVIRGSTPVRMYFDLETTADVDTFDESSLHAVCSTIVSTASAAAGYDGTADYNVFSCHRAIAGGAYKWSMRVITSINLKDSTAAHTVATETRANCPPDVATWIDMSVYHKSSDKWQLLRLPYSAKVWRDDPCAFAYDKALSSGSMMQAETPDQPQSWVTIFNPTDDVAFAPVTTQAINIEMKDVEDPEERDEDDIALARQCVSDALQIDPSLLQDVAASSGSTTIFQCIVPDGRDCFANPGHHHDRQRFYIQLTHKRFLWFKCSCAATCPRIRLVSTLSDQRAERAAIRAAWGDGVEYVTYGDEVKYVHGSGWDKTNRKVLGIQAGCGVGKSTAITSTLQGTNHSLYLLARISQGAAYTDAVSKTAALLGDDAAEVVMYDTPNWRKAKNVACTFESLHKLVQDGRILRDFDTLYLDEVCSLALTSVCKTTNGSHLGTNNQVLKMFFQRARRVVMSDAHLLHDMAVAELIRGLGASPDDIRICAFKHSNIAPDAIIFDDFDYRDSWFASAKKAMSPTRRGIGYVCSSSKRNTMPFEEIASPTIELFTGDGDTKHTSQVWSDPDVNLRDHTGIVATSTLMVGCDLTLPVNRVYADITTQGGCDGVGMLQLASRARRNVSGQVYVLASNAYVGGPTDIEEIIDDMRNMRDWQGTSLSGHVYDEIRNGWSLSVVNEVVPVVRWAPPSIVLRTAYARQRHTAPITESFARIALLSGWKIWQPNGELAVMQEERKSAFADTLQRVSDMREIEAERVYDTIVHGQTELADALTALRERQRDGKATTDDKRYLYDYLYASQIFATKAPFPVARHVVQYRKQLEHLAFFHIDRDLVAMRDYKRAARYGAMPDLNTSPEMHAQIVYELTNAAILARLPSPCSHGATTTSEEIRPNANAIITAIGAISGLRLPKSRARADRDIVVTACRLLSKAFYTYLGFKFERTKERTMSNGVYSHTYKLLDVHNLTTVLQSTTLYHVDRGSPPLVDPGGVYLPQTTAEDARNKRVAILKESLQKQKQEAAAAAGWGDDQLDALLVDYDIKMDMEDDQPVRPRKKRKLPEDDNCMLGSVANGDQPATSGYTPTLHLE